MKLILIGAVGAVVLALAGCSSEPAGPTEAEQRALYCEGFAQLTPGYLESKGRIATLSDPGASTADRAEAMKAQLSAGSDAGRRTHPYDCDLPSDKALFEQYVADAEAAKATSDEE